MEQANKFFSDEELAKGMELVLGDIKKTERLYPCVQLDEIVDYLKNHKSKCTGVGSYRIKHCVEQHYNNSADGSNWRYCANNWVKYAMVMLGWNFRKSIQTRKGVDYTPKFGDLMNNTINWFPK